MASTIRCGHEAGDWRRLISFDRVSKAYPDGTVAVDDLTMKIPAGSFTVFVGPSGCGKTTSMRMINRMVEPTSGAVRVDGADVSTVDPVKLRLGIGYVIQSAGLMPHQRVIDNIATVPVLRGQSRRSARRDAYRVLEQVGLDPKLATRYPAQLSGGEQQRVGVARALAADPPILLMDEPFSAVDPVVRRDLQREMLRLQGELHKTIVFVTHDIDEAVQLADLIAVFGPGGSLQQYGEAAQILARPANEFVSKFVGAGRGYRWLQRLDLTGLTLQDIPQISEDDVAAGNDERVVQDWVLITDGSGAPVGWIDADGSRRHREGAPLSETLAGVGALLRPDGNLSQALDCALSSPAAMGVAVDEAGKVIGGVLASDVLTALDSRKANGRG
jgi:osmoprotectant transport system ATP-binding protein